MEKYNEELNKINIFSTDLFKVPNSNICKFCFLKKINTVGELFDYVDKFGVDYGNTLVKSEIIGIVELLRYKYLCKKMNIDDIINSKFIKNDYTKMNNKIEWYWSKQIKVFRRLGFSREEARLFILFADMNKNELSVGELLMLFYDNFLDNVPYQGDGYYDIFKNKIYLLIIYYKQTKDKYSLDSLKIMYEELKRMILNLKKIEDDIDNKRKEIEEVSRTLILNNSNKI